MHHHSVATVAEAKHTLDIPASNDRQLIVLNPCEE